MTLSGLIDFEGKNAMSHVLKTVFNTSPFREIAVLYFGRPLLVKLWNRITDELEKEKSAAENRRSAEGRRSTESRRSAEGRAIVAASTQDTASQAATKPTQNAVDTDSPNEDRLLH